jgi:hypothetical protein
VGSAWSPTHSRDDDLQIGEVHWKFRVDVMYGLALKMHVEECGSWTLCPLTTSARPDMIGKPVNSGIITAAAAIGGSLVGAIGSVVGTLISSRTATRRDLLGKQIAQREALYSDFIGESARLLVDALQNSYNNLEKLVPIYALLSRIRLSSSTPVLQAAEQLIPAIVARYPRPNMTAEQIESRAINGQDPLRQFSNICRTELSSLQRQL